MKNIKLLLFIAFIGLLSTSCQKALDYFDKNETANTSQVSVYPLFDLVGGNRIAVQKGSAFSDPGCNASEVKLGDADLAITVKGTIDTQTPGVYFLTYIAKNKFNYVDSVKRTILVYEGDLNLNADITGKYKLGQANMNVAHSDILGFWSVGNMNSGSFPVSGEIADIGGGHYIIVPGTVLNPTTGLMVNYSGTAELQTTGALWFYISTSTTPRKWSKV